MHTAARTHRTETVRDLDKNARDENIFSEKIRQKRPALLNTSGPFFGKGTTSANVFQWKRNVLYLGCIKFPFLPPRRTNKEMETRDLTTKTKVHFTANIAVHCSGMAWGDLRGRGDIRGRGEKSEWTPGREDFFGQAKPCLDV